MAEVVSNDSPLLVKYDGKFYFPIFVSYPEVTFGGDFETEADYRDPYMLEKLQKRDNFVLFPFNKNSYNTINQGIDGPVPSPPTKDNLFGTDDRGRDVLARIIYGFRLSILFGLALTLTGTLIGIVAGAIHPLFINVDCRFNA